MLFYFVFYNMKKPILLVTITCITSSILAQYCANIIHFKEENNSIVQRGKTDKRIVFVENSIT